MPPELIFALNGALGYVAWTFCFVLYFWPKLKAMEPRHAQRAIAALHSFRFFGLVAMLPGVVGPALPADFAGFAAYGDLATALLAILALATVRIGAAFGFFVLAFNLVGAGSILGDYAHGVQVNLPAHSGELGAAFIIPALYVPLLMITHIAAFMLMLRSRRAAGARP